MPELRHRASGQAGAPVASLRESQTKMPITDIHTHFFPESWPDLAARFGTPDWPWIKHTGPGKAVIMLGEREFRRINLRLLGRGTCVWNKWTAMESTGK